MSVHCRALAGVVVVAAALGAPAGIADAAIGGVHVQPASGPPGTHVTVSGTGCNPGLVRSASQDYVSVTSTTGPAGAHAPVDGSGGWSTTFTVPSGAVALPAAITAACFTDGLPSLTTIYLPATFSVTAGTAPGSAPPGSTTPAGPVNGPTTTRSSGAAGSGASPTPAGTPVTVESAGGSPAGSAAPGASTAAGDATPARSHARAAGLRSPELAARHANGPGGVSWWWWVVLVLLVAGTAGAWLWVRRRGALAARGSSPDVRSDDGAEPPGPDGAAGVAVVDDDTPVPSR
jgi:hypothetical protein